MDDYEFLVSDGNGRFHTRPFPGRRFIVGAGPECQMRFEGAGLFQNHAEVLLDHSNRPWVRDLTGQKLVVVNSEAISHAAIHSGALVRLGSLELLVRRRDAGRAGETCPAPLRPGDNDPDLPRGSLSPGTVIDDRYRVVRKLAAGGMGEVYLAEHIQLEKPIALKVMLPSLSRAPALVARFKREAIAASRIGQQNIICVFDFGQTQDGSVYFVMEYLDGETLTRVVAREGAMRMARVIAVASQVARALAAAHAQGIVHRDLKPENVMLVQQAEQPDFVKILDFGIAKVGAAHAEGDSTLAGTLLGTPRYMSPEQAKALTVDARTDIYSLGLIAYELVTGRPAFTAETPSSLLVKQVTEPPPPLRPGPIEEVPAALEDLILQMLAKDPSERPQTMDEVVKRLLLVDASVKAGAALAPASGALAMPSGIDAVRGSASLPILAPPFDASDTLESLDVPNPLEPLGQAAQSPGSLAGAMGARSALPWAVFLLSLLSIIGVAGFSVLRAPEQAGSEPNRAPLAEAVEPERAPPPIPAPTPTLQVKSSPTGAEVSKNDSELQRAPSKPKPARQPPAAVRFDDPSVLK